MILTASGTNCDYETKFAFEFLGARADIIHINQIKSGKVGIETYHILVLPGGFTYGDYVSAGKILANELRFGLRDHVEKFINDGKLILGICNGFQVLVKAGILPGFDDYFTEQVVTLSYNDSNRFEDRWVYLKHEADSKSIFTSGVDRLIYLPVAHAEGKFMVKSEKIIDRLISERQIVFKYVDEKGDKADYPWNPNGSIRGIAAICDPSGRILGMMPHPERFVRKTQHPRWSRMEIEEPDGVYIFKSALSYVQKNL